MESIDQLRGLERGKVALLLRSEVTFTCSLSPNTMSKLMILLEQPMCSVWVTWGVL